MPRKISYKGAKIKAWQWFSRYIRLKYSDEGGTNRCFTCGKLMYWKDSQCGHFVPGRSNDVICNEDCVKVQCYSCNVGLGGNYTQFTLNLLAEGLTMGQIQSRLNLKYGAKKVTKAEWLEKAEYYKQKAEEEAEERGITL